jgi:iron complex transport system substrate-binding protein
MRIVSLLPSATEILFAIGAGDQVVGVTHECDFPRSAATRPILTSSLLPPELDAAGIDRHVRARVHAGSSLYGLDDAKLAALAPDLIVTQELCPVCAVSYETVARAAKRLRPSTSSGQARVVSLEPSSLEDVFATIALLGDLTGTAEGAAALLATLRARVEALRRRVAGRPRPRVLVLEWTEPPMVAAHWTPGLVELAGGEPVAEAPDVAIVAPCGFDLRKARAAAQSLPSPAPRVYAMDGSAYVNRPGPRLVESAELFAAAIHGEPTPYPDALELIVPPAPRSAAPTP